MAGPPRASRPLRGRVRSRARLVGAGVPGASGRPWSEVRGRYARLWQVLRGGRVVPGVPGRFGRTWSEVRGRYARSWQVLRGGRVVPGVPGVFRRPQSSRAYLVSLGVPGRKFVAGTPVRGRYSGAAGWFRAYLVVPGVPGVFGRTWSEVRGRYSRDAGAPSSVSACGARSWRRARPAAGRCRSGGAVRPHSAAAGPRSDARARRSRPARW